MILQTTWETLERPERLPLEKPPVELGRRLRNTAEVSAAIRDIIDADVKTYDAHGLPVVVDAHFLGNHLEELGRSRYLPLLPDLIEHPYEIWVQIERGATSGHYRVRSRFVKAYDLGNGWALFAVFNRQDGVLLSWTFFPTSDWQYINRRVRNGMLWWGK